MVSAKDLADAGVAALPPDYIKSAFSGRLDVAAEKPATSLPVLDLSGLDSRRPQLVEDIRKACEEWGFFQLVGHGFPAELMSEMRGQVEAFFKMPPEERRKYYTEDIAKPFRFGTSFRQHDENTMRSRKWWYDYLFQVCNPWPTKEDDFPYNSPKYRDTVAKYSSEARRLAKTLLGLISESLGLGAEVLESKMIHPEKHHHVMRLNFFPPCPNPDLAIGIDVHSDIGGITILQQDELVKGLEVYHDGKWVIVEPVPGALVVNVADQMQILTNGRYKSVQHRVVVNSTKSRITIASFYNPSFDTYIEPMKELLELNPGEEPHYRGCVYGDYRTMYFATVAGTETPKLLLSKKA